VTLFGIDSVVIELAGFGKKEDVAKEDWATVLIIKSSSAFPLE